MENIELPTRELWIFPWSAARSFSKQSSRIKTPLPERLASDWRNYSGAQTPYFDRNEKELFFLDMSPVEN
jgi:hypothetical protein